MSQAELEKQRGDGAQDSLSLHNEKLEDLLRENDFESMSAESILTWVSSAFSPGRAVLSTSFQYTGVAMIHMLRQLDLEIRIATVDTLRLHPETYAYIRELEQHYGIEIEVQRPDPEQVRSMVDRFGEYLFFDSKARQEYCCQVRKLRPHDELLKTVDCWISGVRRDQSAVRERNTPKATTVAEYGSRRQIFKLNPMSDWTEERVREYVAENRVPVHPLYAKGYRSIGCIICSTPTLPGEDQRAGRWRWFNGNETIGEEELKECGLLVPVYNI
jgi:phosphoadenosine phosphosulfate reductase